MHCVKKYNNFCATIKSKSLVHFGSLQASVRFVFRSDEQVLPANLIN